MKWLFGFAVAIATSVSGAMTPAYALTCTAPGQDTCTITCPAGCIAIYRVPSGPCRIPRCSSPSLTRSMKEAFHGKPVRLSEMVTPQNAFPNSENVRRASPSRPALRKLGRETAWSTCLRDFRQMRACTSE